MRPRASDWECQRPVNLDQVAELFIVADATSSKFPPGQCGPDDDYQINIYLTPSIYNFETTGWEFKILKKKKL